MFDDDGFPPVSLTFPQDAQIRVMNWGLPHVWEMNYNQEARETLSKDNSAITKWTLTANDPQQNRFNTQSR